MENSTTGSVGKVIQLNGQAQAVSEAGTRELHLDSEVFQGDTIVTKSASNLEIVFNDDTSLSQGENAKAVINTYVYDPEHVDGASLLLEMGKGVFRTVTGEIAKENPDNFKLKSPMALIGIRGTVVNSDIKEGHESIGVETIGKGHVLVVQDSQGNIQFISDPLKIMEILAGQPLSAPRNMSRQELNNFQNAAPNSVDMDPARQAELNARVDAAEAEAAAEEAEQAAQEAEDAAAQAEADADAKAQAEEEAKAALEEAQEEGDEQAIAEAEAALKAAEEEAARAEAEEAAAKAAAQEAQAAKEAAQAEAEAKAQAVKDMTPDEPEEYEPADDPGNDDNQGTDDGDTGDNGNPDDGDTGDTGDTGNTEYKVIGLVEVDAEGDIQYAAAAGEGQGQQGQNTGTGNQGNEDDTNTVNLGPVVVNDSGSGEEDGNPITINVLANDSDPEGDSLSIESFTQGSNGSVSLAGTSLVYTANPDFNGTDTFKYFVSDGNGNSTEGSVTVTVTPVNDTPRPVDDTALTQKGQGIDIRVLDNDGDPDGSGLTLVDDFSTPANGTVSISGDGQSVVYTPDSCFFGTDTFTYTVRDGEGDTDTATVTVTVNGPVTPTDDSAGTNENTAVSIDVLANDHDLDGDALTVTDASNPAHGSVVVNADNTISYTPDEGYYGTDSFDYTVSDSNGSFDTATVTVTVNGAPNAADDMASTAEDTGVTIDVLTGSDTDPEGDSLSVDSQMVMDPSHGSVEVNPDNTITYTPDADYNGNDSFTYTVRDDSGNTDTATVNITVTPENDPPEAVDDTASTAEDTDVVIDVLANDGDIDGDSLAIHALGTPSHGRVSLVDGEVLYTPDADFNGSDSFTYTVDDGNGGQDTATVTVTVNPVNDAPVAVTDDKTVDEDGSVTFDVLANDIDADDYPLYLDDVSQPSHGTVIVNENGTVTYTPDSDYDLDDSFTYTVSDGNGGTSQGTVNITVTPSEDAPEASDYSGSTEEHTSLEGQLEASDPDTGDSLYYYLSSGPYHGNVSIDASSGSFVYTPDEDYTGNGSSEYDDSFEYTVEDSTGASASAVAKISINHISEEITGSSISETLYGLGDSDVLYGMEGDDVLFGDMPSDDSVTGDDLLYGGPGDDSLMGGPGDDILDGGDGNDYLAGHAGDDSLLGGDGDDFLIGHSGDDTISGGDGSDTLFGGTGINYLSGGDGIDQIGYDAGSIDDVNFAGITADISNDGSGVVQGHHQDGGNLFLDFVSGIENLSGSEFNDTMIGGDGNNVFWGQEGDDLLSGGDGRDFLYGEDGADTLAGGDGWDTLSGGQGSDILDGGHFEYDNYPQNYADYSGDAGGITANIQYNASNWSFDGSTVLDGSSSTDTVMNITRYTGSAFDDTITVSIDDIYNQSYLRWYVWGGEGEDSITGTDGERVRVMYNDDPGNVTVDLANNQAVDGWGDTDVLDNIYAVSGSNFDDSITGDLLHGSGSDELFFGTLGNDTLYGGGGDDWLSYTWLPTDEGVAGVEINAQDGTAKGWAWDGTTLVFKDTFSEFEAYEGSELNDTIIGGDEAEVLTGWSGNDILMGGHGADTLEGSSGWFDVASYEDAPAGIRMDIGNPYQVWDGTGNWDELSGVEIVQGSSYNDTLIGTGEYLIFEGGQGNDYINAGYLVNQGEGVVSYANDLINGTTGMQINLNAADGGVMMVEDGWGFTDTLVNITGVGGTQGDDTITGLNGVSGRFAGQAGDDIIDGGSVDLENYESRTDGANHVHNLISYGIDPAGVTVHLEWSGEIGLTGYATDGWNDTDTLYNFMEVWGSDYDDELFFTSDTTGDGFKGEWWVTGLAGNDTIHGDANAATIVDYAPAGYGVTVNLEDGWAWDGLGGTDILYDVSGAVGSDYGDDFIGDDKDNYFYGRGGDDIMIGGAGNDTLDGGEFEGNHPDNEVDYSQDPITEGDPGINAYIAYNSDASDPFAGSTVKDGWGDTDTLKNISVLIGSHGDDTMVFDITDESGSSDVRWWVTGLAGDDSIVGSFEADGRDERVRVSYMDDPDAVYVNLAEQTATDGWDYTDTLKNIEAVMGSDYDDTIIGNDDQSTGFVGTLGNDSMDASLYSGEDSSWVSYYYLGDEGENFYGVDLDLASQRAFGIDIQGNADLFEDTLIGIAQAEGSLFSDTLRGDEHDNTLWGDEGGDLLEGRGGDDLLIAGDGDDTLFGGDGQDTLTGGNGSNALDGEGDFDVVSYADSYSGISVSMHSPVSVFHGTGEDTLENIEYIQGSSYNDFYDGDGRSMIFEGGAGNDTIYGGTDGDADAGVSYLYAPVDGDGTGVTVSLEGASSGGVYVDDGYGTKDFLVNVRTLVGSMGDDTLTGEAGVKNWLIGMTGSDSIDGGALTEWGYENTASYELATGAVSGGIVYDYDSTSFTGSLIDDNLGARDTLTNITRLEGSDYNDNLSISLSGGGSTSFLHWYFRGSDGNDTFTGTQGYHVGVMYNNADGAVNVDLDGHVATKMDSLGGVTGVDSLVDIEEVMGSDFNDTIYGEVADGNVFIGSLGNDILDGRAFGYGDMVVYDDYAEDYIGMEIDLAAGTDGDGKPTGTAVAMGESGVIFTDTLYHMDAVLAGDGDDTIIGSERANTLYGQGGNDEFTGSLGYDFISGGDGWDEISYRDLSAALTGISLGWNAEDGQWNLAGHNGEIMLFGDILEDMEVFEGTDGNDTFSGNSDDTFFEGTYGNDSYDGGEGTDHVSYDDIDYGIEDGTLAGMIIDLNAGAVSSPYATGFDSDSNILFTDTLDNIEIITGSISNDSIIGDSQGNDLRGAAGNDTIEGGEGSDYISGGDGNDSLLGGSGSDNIHAGFGNDYVDGGSGGEGYDWDMVSYTDLSGFNGIDLTWDSIQGQWTVIGIDTDDTSTLFEDILVNVEGFQGSQYEDEFHGNTQINYFLGSLGNDFYDGGDGSDHLSYYMMSWDGSITSGLEIDLVSGTVETSADEANGFTDTFSHMEEIMGTQFDDRFIGGAQSYTVHGGDGTDEISYASMAGQGGIYLSYVENDTTQAFVVNGYDSIGGIDFTDTLDGIEAFEGSGYNDAFYGHTTDDIFYGTFGNDSYNGLGGTDSLIYDRISHPDLIGMEIDLDAGTARAVDGTVDGLFLDTIQDIESVTGSAFDDTIYADDDGGQIIGAGGADEIHGGIGSDNIDGGFGSDTIFGSMGNDFIYGGIDGDAYLEYFSITDNTFDHVSINLGTGEAFGYDSSNAELFQDEVINVSGAGGSIGNDSIFGGDAGEYLKGGAGSDWIDGGAGDDNIWGGSGSDTLFGGSGYDTFEITHTSENDEIRDFQVTDAGSGKDTLLFSESLLNVTSQGTYLFGQSGSNQLDSNAFHIIGVTGDQAEDGWSNYLDVINNAVDASLDDGTGNTGTYFIVNNGTNEYDGDARIYYWEGDTTDDNLVGSDEIVELVTLTDTSLSDINDMTEEQFSIA